MSQYSDIVLPFCTDYIHYKVKKKTNKKQNHILPASLLPRAAFIFFSATFSANSKSITNTHMHATDAHL